MPAKTTDTAPKKLSNNNTKQEMLKAYGEVLQQLEEQRNARPAPQEQIEQRQAQEAVTVAEELSTDGVVRQVGQVRADIGTLLGQVSEKLEEQVDRYGKVAKAIASKEKELGEIYEIQKSALSLTALIQTQQRKQEEFAAEMDRKRQELDQDIQSTREQWTEEKKRYESEIKERDAAEEKRRKREAEEYKYAFAREQQLARDQFADEKAKAERELAERRAESEKDLNRRQADLAQREEQLAALQKQSADFPKQLDEAIAKAVKETTARLQAEAAGARQLQERAFEGERNVLTTRIAALEKTVQEQERQLTRLSQQSEKAYGQVQEIAVRAIEGSAGKSFASLQQLLADQQRKQPEK
jgi:hypothetical protein